MQFEQLNKLLSTGSTEDATLALKIIETKITIEYAIAAACLIRKSKVPEECREQEKDTLNKISTILVENNGMILDVHQGSAQAFFNYSLSHMRSIEDATIAFEMYQSYIKDVYESAVRLKLRGNYKTG